ncbi:MAG: HAD-IA family hydrolase [Candidatus Aenigmarchaeota archaeon]|nr:HAD-IA family hydrolase [Candidatus Aenigmarchaeota archaeon]
MIKGILFDLDNTLIDFLKIKKKSCEESISAMIKAGLPLKKTEALKILYDIYERYGIEYQKIFQEFLMETTGKIDYRILAEGIVAYRRVKNSMLTTFPHVIPTLKRLRENDFKLGIVSDAPRLQAWLRLVELKIVDFFQVVVALKEEGEEKPSKVPFLNASKELKLRPYEILFVGENPKKDIEGAKAVGMKTALALYGLTYRKPPREMNADYVLHDFSDILKILNIDSARVEKMNIKEEKINGELKGF